MVVGVVVAGLITVWALYQTPSATLTLGDGQFALRVARTAAERQQGLSGTEQLPEHEALLFDFQTDDTWGIWMKDMNYPIDIVWLDASKKVVHIVKHAPPSSYPETIYRPADRARYVIELKAGAVDSKRITRGTRAVFDGRKGLFE